MSIQYQYVKVREFMELAGQIVNYDVSQLTYKQAAFRKTLIQEEIFGPNELIDSMKNDNRKGVLDGICDVLYVVHGTMVSYGLTPVVGADHMSFEIENKIPSVGTSCRHIQNLRGYFEKYERALYHDDSHGVYEACVSIVDEVHYIGRSFGVDVLNGFSEVHESNMSKFSTDSFLVEKSIALQLSKGKTDYEGAYVEELKNGYFAIKRLSDGKILKPTSFFEPDLSKFI